MSMRDQLVEEVRSWKGTRWVHQAALKGVGVDCFNLMFESAKTVGAVTQDQFDDPTCPILNEYGMTPPIEKALSVCGHFMIPIRYEELRKGDIVMIRFVKVPSHFAMVTETGPLSIIHVMAFNRKVTEHRVDAVWRERIVHCFRFKHLQGVV